MKRIISVDNCLDCPKSQRKSVWICRATGKALHKEFHKSIPAYCPAPYDTREVAVKEGLRVSDLIGS